jgi:anti-anti-sigma factor
MEESVESSDHLVGRRPISTERYRKRILVVDDSDAVREIVRKFLERSGYLVCGEAANGAEAITKARQSKPDLIVMDLVMPGTNGIEATSLIRATMPDVPIVLFTMYEAIAKSMTSRLAINTVVAKPDGVSELLESIRRATVDLQISIRESGDVTILDLRGRATIGADGDLLSSHLQGLVAKGVRKLLLNLAGVTQMDSSGISAITGMFVSLRRQGGSLKLLRPCGQVREVLRVIHLPDIIPTFEDEAQALASFRPQGFSARP